MLRAELAKPSYVISPINIGSNTDPYQPIEKQWRLTRAALELLAECHHPCTIVTKNALVERDLDILVSMAREQLVQVFVSVNSLDNHLAAKLEPRAVAALVQDIEHQEEARIRARKDFMRAQLSDPDLDDKTKRKVRAKWAELHPDEPAELAQ